MNYMDRGNLSISVPMLKEAVHVRVAARHPDLGILLDSLGIARG